MESKLIIKINEAVIKYAFSSIGTGLFNGKMGTAVYTYLIAKIYGNTVMQELTEKLTDDRIDLKDVTFLMPLRLDSLERIAVLSNKSKNSETSSPQHIEVRAFL